MHESGDFRYDREIWGPTPAQQRYDTRTDLGNTPEKDGDGYLYRGRTGMQLTAKDNYRQFRDWCRAAASTTRTASRIRMLSTLTPGKGSFRCSIGTRAVREPPGRRRRRPHHHEEDQRWQERSGRPLRPVVPDLTAVLLGYRVDNVRQFQADQRLDVDGDVGPKFRAAIYKALVALKPGEATRPEVKVASVTEEKPVPVTPPRPTAIPAPPPISSLRLCRRPGRITVLVRAPKA